MMRAVLLALTLVVAASAAKTWYGCQLSTEQATTGPTPPPQPGTGGDNAYGAINCVGDDVANTLNCTVSWSGLLGLVGGGAIAGMHLHGPVGQGSDSTSLKWQWPAGEYAGKGATGSTGPVVFSGLVAGDHTELFNQRFYFNLHTTLYAGGELRCQMYPIQPRFQADLTVGNIGFGGGSVTGGPTGYGRGWATFNPTTMTLALRVYWWGLLGNPSAAGLGSGVHMHGPASFAGTAGVLQAMVADAGSDATFGSASATFTLDEVQMVDLGSNKYYFAIHTATNVGGEIRGQLKMGNSANSPSAGTYEQACTARGADMEKVCMTVNSIGQVYWQQAYYKAATSCGVPTWAKAVNFTMATLGINQKYNRATLGSELDMGVVRPWQTRFATQSSSDISDIGSSCPAATCPGYSGNRFARSLVMRPTCPNSCELLKEMYGNFYINGVTIQMTAMSTAQTGWTNTARTYYNFAQATTCNDFIAEVPLAGRASAVAPSVLAIAAAAILAALRV